MSNRLMTKAEFGQLVHKTAKQVDWMLYTGKAPKSALIGGRRMFRESDVTAWIDAQFEDAEKVSA